MSPVSRRDFLRLGAVATVGAASYPLLRQLGAIETIDNPLDAYPFRDWEHVYRDQYKYDDSFTFICSPNDTHACRLRAFTRNGVIQRIEQNYDVGRYQDQLGNKSTVKWHPRGCKKGMTFHRRVYGPYRLKYPLVRAGWKRWADDGFPELTPANRDTYKFKSRGTDSFTRLTWDDAYGYLARGLVNVAETYSGDEGARRLREEGYQPEMIDEMGGAGTRTMKFRGGMGLLGVIGKYGMYRLNNTMALLDARVRGVGPDEARAGRNWSNYTWHGDQAPGHPFVHGLQTSEPDFNDLANSKLTIQVGKNLVENKMPESHFFSNIMEHGGKIVTIAPEYGAPASKSDYWLPVRPGLSDTSIFLAITKILMDEGLHDAAFVTQFTDFPFLIRTDTLMRLRAKDVFPGYQPALEPSGPSFRDQKLTQAQYERVGGDFVVFDEGRGALRAITRDDVGQRMVERGFKPKLDYRATVRLVDGSEAEVLTLWEAYRDHLVDYDLDTVQEITGTPKDLITRLAHDIATIKPVAIHTGEGINHWFHATLHNRATYLPLMLTGNIGLPGAGSHTWAGNYKAALFQSTDWSGPGFKGWVAEDPFEPNLDDTADGKDIVAHGYGKDEEPAYWDHGDRALIVETPRFGRKNFTGQTHMPTPTKVIWTTNVNLINNAKNAYLVIRDVNPHVDMIVTQDIEMTASCELSDFVLPANSWVEFQTSEVTASCSNPFLQIWGRDGIKPLYDSEDDLMMMAKVAERLGQDLDDPRFANYWKFALEGRGEVYLQRLLDASATTRGYTVTDIKAGKYGEPGAALMMFRTYPRIPFWEQIHDDQPFFTDTGRMHSYVDIPEAIEYGENFIVHREGPEATPYLPNVIVSSNPLIRPEDYGIARDELDPDMRTVRNIRLPWAEAKLTKNPLWEQGFQFYFLTPKSRHTVHSGWAVTDWETLWGSNFGDPHRRDKRLPHLGDREVHMNPQAAVDLGLKDGDYVWIDANPIDRPYPNYDPNDTSDPFHKVARLMLRVKFNPAYPYNVLMAKHGYWLATEKTVKAHETRPDGLAKSEDTGYQSSYRYGSHQSVTRDWAMPMHQTDTLFHKQKVAVGFMFGGEADNHAINTVPKETLVRVTKAEDGGMGGRGAWEPGTSGMSPGNEDERMRRYLDGSFLA
ncbi:MAG: molybdopterin-dependent oxidoreductase [Chloroflexi bacterium]|nr:molybdopterin-dependent oxidoreductase [Chloroflexota bacterium]MQC27512.1 nitrate oxidoreductase subunit alpha [Chloroflexota bacterium]